MFLNLYFYFSCDLIFHFITLFCIAGGQGGEQGACQGPPVQSQEQPPEVERAAGVRLHQEPPRLQRLRRGLRRPGKILASDWLRKVS